MLVYRTIGFLLAAVALVTSDFHAPEIVEDLLDRRISSIPVNFDDGNMTRSDVVFRLYIKPEDAKGRWLDETKVQSLKFNRNLPAKFFVHGFRASCNSSWYGLLKHVYFRRGPYNIFYVDWSKGAFKLYNNSAANVKPCGTIVGDFILASGIPLDRVHVIGNGLGAMVAAFVGKRTVERTRKKIMRITAADPQSAKFEHRQVTKRMRLSEIDATFVEVIHSDAGNLGFSDTIGHADFFPNGGFLQPDCRIYEDADLFNCNHEKAMEYFIESVNYPMYMATKCATWKIFLKGLCHRNPKVLVGEHTDLKAKGSFYYFTRRRPILT